MYIQESTTLPAIIGYFEKNSDDIDYFIETSKQIGPYYRFALITDATLLQELKYTGTNIYVHRPTHGLNTKIDKPKSRYPSKVINQKSLLKFIYDKSLHTIGEKNNDNNILYSNINTPILNIYTDINRDKNEKGYQYILTRLNKIHTIYKNQFYYTIITNKSQNEPEISDYQFPLNLSQKKDAILVGISTQELVYTMNTPFSVDNIVSFIEQYKAGSIVGLEKVPP